MRVTKSALTRAKNLNVQTPRERKSKERADLDDQDSQPLVSDFNTQAYVGWPKPKKRGYPRMTPADFKMVLGFDRDTNRAYQALRSEIIVYMKGLGIDSHNRAQAPPEVWEGILDWVSRHRYLDRFKQLYDSKTLGANVRLAVHHLSLTCARQVTRERTDTRKSLQNTTFEIDGDNDDGGERNEREYGGGYRGNYSFIGEEDFVDDLGPEIPNLGGGIPGPEAPKGPDFAKRPIVVLIIDPDKLGVFTGGTFDFGRNPESVVFQYPTMLKHPTIDAIYKACAKHLPKGRTPRAIYGSTRKQCRAISAGGGGDAVILTDDDEVESWLLDASAKGLNSLSVIAVLYRGFGDREDTPLDSWAPYIDPKVFSNSNRISRRTGGLC